MYYVLVSGKRDFTDYAAFCEKMDDYISDIQDEITIVEGGAKGADAMAVEYALDHKYYFLEFPAYWQQYGKAAGAIRNQEMVNYLKNKVCRAIFFWDGKSRGTGDCLMRAKRAGIKCEINYI